MKRIIKRMLVFAIVFNLVACGNVRKPVELELHTITSNGSSYKVSDVPSLKGSAKFVDDSFEEGELTTEVLDSVLSFKLSDKKFEIDTDSGDKIYSYKLTSTTDNNISTGYAIIGESDDGKYIFTLSLTEGNTKLMWSFVEVEK